MLLARRKKEYPNIAENGTCEDPNVVHDGVGLKK